MKITTYAPAKLNLTLDILGRRENGYHDIKTIMQTISLYDTIVMDIEDSNENIITSSCTNAHEFPDIKWDETNLINKAALVFLQASNITAKIHLTVTKNIPSGAGMGGGSSDAAAVLSALNEYYKKALPMEALLAIATKLGADVPFLILKGTALCEGIGEILTTLAPIKNIFVVVAKPIESISTKYLYEAVDNYLNTTPHPEQDSLIHMLHAPEPHTLSMDEYAQTDEAFDTLYNQLISTLSNFFEPAAIKHLPLIAQIKKDLLKSGADASIMTGSGSAVFGIFKSKDAAQKAYNELTEAASDGMQYYLAWFI